VVSGLWRRIAARLHAAGRQHAPVVEPMGDTYTLCPGASGV